MPSRALESATPFRSSKASPTPFATKLSGQLPDWLRGQVVRTCPAVFQTAGWRAEHWFDGLGMLYAFRIDDAGVTFQSRMLECETAREAARGKTRLGSFGTPLVRNLWQRIFEPLPRITDNTNVNIVKMGDDLVAMTENDRQLIIDEGTLRTRGAVKYGADGLQAAIMTAHPHYDFERGRVVNVATKLGPSSSVSVYEHGPRERKRKVVGSWRTSAVPYVHSFGLTPAHAVLIAHPLTVKASAMLWSNKGFIDHFGWHPEQGTRLIVIDRATGAMREHVTDPFFVFHTVNCFERDGATVLDLLAYKSADIVSALRIERLNDHLPELRPDLLRITMKPGQERANSETLSDSGFEFPSTNYRRVNGRDYRFAFGATVVPRQSGYDSRVVKVDVTNGTTQSYATGIDVFGEPIFVANPNGNAEDDGVLVAVGSREGADVATLAVIDAKTMELLASAEVASAIPLGFHGSFLRQKGEG
jgi:carotenoid cleavage dioxygenase-like enzyme